MGNAGFFEDLTLRLVAAFEIEPLGMHLGMKDRMLEALLSSEIHQIFQDLTPDSFSPALL